MAEPAYEIYQDINNRTNGEIYIGVVGPVRTGKSTFIKRFMEEMVLPNMTDPHARQRAIDEMPQSGSGVMIMTTEPKFVPKDAAKIQVEENLSMNVRLIDCVGYMVDKAKGHMEDDIERMVKTPWFDYDIPFSIAAETGTRKVIKEHSTIGVVITNDGSIGEIPRQDFESPEEQTISQLKAIKKPFIVVLNSVHPHSNETKTLAKKLTEKYQVSVIPINCDQLKKADILQLLESLLMEFPIKSLGFDMPKWMELVPDHYPLKETLISEIKHMSLSRKTMKDIGASFCKQLQDASNEKGCSIFSIDIQNKDLSNGTIDFCIKFEEQKYYDILTELSGASIHNDYELVLLLSEYAKMKNDYSKLSKAMDEVKDFGYGIVTPNRAEIELGEPELFRQGNRYGVKIKANAPSIHMIQTSILTEIAPVVGTKEQAEDLMNYMVSNANATEQGIFATKIFGKTIEQIVDDGICDKIHNLSPETKDKMKHTLERITNESAGGVICIIL